MNEQIRKEFEQEWELKYGSSRLAQMQSIGGDVTGEYKDPRVQRAWVMWQAAHARYAAQPKVPDGYALVLADELSRITLDHKRYRWIRDGGWLLIGEDRGNGAEWPPADIVDLKVDKHISKAMLSAQENNK